MAMKLVLTGGPCSGKTTVLRALKEEFGNELLLVPEVATMLLEGGFPVPGRDLPWSEAWQAAFQQAVLPLQLALEDAYCEMAAAVNARLIICDRGVLDGAAYTPGGLPEFAGRYQLQVDALLARYDAIVHLESLATADPTRYGKSGNDHRFEPLERATELEHAVRAAWSGHPRRIQIDGRRGIEGKIAELIGMTRYLLTTKGEGIHA